MSKFRVGDYISKHDGSITWEVIHVRLYGRIYYSKCIKNNKDSIYHVGDTWHLDREYTNKHYHRLNKPEILALVL